MKKFEEPIIRIDMFNIENIITTSGGDTKTTALELATDRIKAIGVSDGNYTSVKWTL